MLCPDCQAPIDSGAVFCGHCGAPLPPMHAGKSLATGDNLQMPQGDQWHNDILDNVLEHDEYHVAPVSTARYPSTPLPINEASQLLSAQSVAFVSSSAPLLAAPRSKEHARPPSVTGRNLVSIAVIIALLGVGIAAGVFAIWQNKSLVYKAMPAKSVAAPNAQGAVTFHDSANSTTNSVNISVHGLTTLRGNTYYAAWIVAGNGVHIHSLGSLVKTGTTYTLNFVDSNTNILSLGNKILVTVEATHAALPTGRIVLSAQIPTDIMPHVDALLVSYPTTPHQIALLPGLRSQTQLVYNASQQLSTTQDQPAIQCLAQNILTVLNGQRPTNEVVTAQTCTSLHIPQVSLDLGLLGSDNNGYVNIVSARASLASSQPDATTNVRQNAQYVMIASNNLQQWFTTINQDANSLLQDPTQTSVIQNIAQQSNYALNGVDSNNDGKISPTTGEAGATQAYLYGQSMASLILTATVHK